MVDDTEAAVLDDEGTNPERAAGMANMAKYVAVEAAIEACYQFVNLRRSRRKKYHQERCGEVQLFRLAPPTQNDINFTGSMCWACPNPISDQN